MTNKIGKNIILFIIFFVLSLFVCESRCYAKKLNNMEELLAGSNIGNSIYVKRNGDGAATTLDGNKNLYCFQKGTHMHEGDYHIDKYIRINEDKATVYYKENNIMKNKTITNNSNISLLYILETNYGFTGEGRNRITGFKGYGYHGNEYYTNNPGIKNVTERQKALWKYGDTWMSQVGIDIGVNWVVLDPNALDQDDKDRFDVYKDYELLDKGERPNTDKILSEYYGKRN